MEEWRPTHHPDYDVSDLGRVRSHVFSTFRIMKTLPDSRGYPRVNFRVVGTPSRRKAHRVHRLVATAFIGPLPVGQECRHKDDNRLNGRLDNIEYGTHQQNCQNSVMRRPLHMIRLTVEQVEAIRHLYVTTNITQVELARMFRTGQPHISAIIRRVKWACV